MYTSYTKQEAHSAPKKLNRQQKSEREVVPHIAITVALFLCCTATATLLQVAECHGISSHPFEVGAEPPQEDESFWPERPAVSMVTGVTVWYWSRAEYFSCLLCLARAAAAPVSLVVLARWE